jgi:hypothetical protein
MNFLIADPFTASFNRLSGVDQKAVKAIVFDLQMDRTGKGLQLHRIDKSKDPNSWSARVNRDVRPRQYRDPSSVADTVAQPRRNGLGEYIGESKNTEGIAAPRDDRIPRFREKQPRFDGCFVDVIKRHRRPVPWS